MVPDEPILVESSSWTYHSGGGRLAVWAVPGGAAASARSEQSGSSDQPKAGQAMPGNVQTVGDSSLTSASMTTSQEDEESELARRREALRRALAEHERTQPRWPGEPERPRRRPVRSQVSETSSVAAEVKRPGRRGESGGGALRCCPRQRRRRVHPGCSGLRRSVPRGAGA